MKEELDKQGSELKILQLKDNILPRGLVPLDELFDHNDVAKRPKLAPVGEGIEECNIPRKKTGEIRLCIDFKNLIRVSLKDNYLLPKMDHVLQKLVGAKRMSLLDGFSQYNQILVHPKDQDKIAFITPWGTFKYAKMPFNLMNVGATFQRAMNIAFEEEKDNFFAIYLDDIIVYSQSHEEHLQHLRAVLEKCRKHGISLNPKKSLH
eukprot:PITA_04502